jgi:hypothetical protein
MIRMVHSSCGDKGFLARIIKGVPRSEFYIWQPQLGCRRSCIKVSCIHLVTSTIRVTLHCKLLIWVGWELCLQPQWLNRFHLVGRKLVI